MGCGSDAFVSFSTATESDHHETLRLSISIENESIAIEDDSIAKESDSDASDTLSFAIECR
jgi:hypothetical protein